MLEHGIHATFNGAQDPFSMTILLVGIWSRELMLDSRSSKVSSEGSIEKFTTIVRPEGMNTKTRLILPPRTNSAPGL
jgi:hypothetical protein